MSSTTSGGLLRRHHDFRLLWCGEVTGKFGAAVTSVTMPLVAVSTLQATTFQVTLLSAAAWLPWLIIGLPVGVWVDRSPRRPIMVAANVASLLLFASIPAAALLGDLTLTHLLAVALLAGTAAVFFQTAYTAYLPTIVAAQDRLAGNAKLHGSAAVAQIAGLGSAGLIAQLVGAVTGLLANAGTFAVSLLCLLGIRHREPPAAAAHRPPSGAATVGGIIEGLRLVTGDAWFRSMTLFAAVSNFFLIGYQSIQVVFLVREVGLDAGAVGGLISAASLGGVGGAFFAPRVARRLGTARTLLLFEIGLPTMSILMPLTSEGARLLLYPLGSLCVSAGVVGGNVMAASFRQGYCPPALLGRLTASTAFLGYAAIPLGALASGALSSPLGVHPTMWIMTAGVPLAGLILLFSPIRKCRDLPVSHELRSPTASVTADRPSDDLLTPAS